MAHSISTGCCNKDDLNAYTTNCGAHPMDQSVFYPSQRSPKPVQRNGGRGMEGLVGLVENLNQELEIGCT